MGVSAQTDSDATSAVTTSDEYYYVYFAAPVEWTNNGYTIKFNGHRQSDNDDKNTPQNWKKYIMSDTGKTIGNDNQKVYVVSIPKKDIENGNEGAYGGYSTVQFQAYDGTKWIKEETPFKEQWTDILTIKDKIYDGNSWSDYNPGPAKLAGKKLFFKNGPFTKDTEFTFYVNGTEVDESELSYSNKKNVWSYKFPTDSDATVETKLKVSVGGKEYEFYWTDTSKNLIVISDDSAEVSEIYTYVGTTTVYFDATLSKLGYTTDDKAKTTNGMPYATKDDSKIYYYATDNSNNKVAAGEMQQDNTNENLWYVENLTASAKKIRFAAWGIPENGNAAEKGDGTGMETIPTELDNPCFYADTSDDVIYNGGNRSGYWDEVNKVHDAEAGKQTTVNKIGSGVFEQKSGVKYVNSTLYDYYSDYELNGKSRGSYDQTDVATQRNWVPFRQLDQALSDYYYNEKIEYPIYTGHFQPDYFTDDDKKLHFSLIQSPLNLYGYNQTSFMAINNSTLNQEGVDKKGSKYGDGKDTSVPYYDYATQGLVNPDYKDNVLKLAGSSLAEPHFDEAFLTGSNSKNTKLGEIYKNVAFPFTQKEIYGDEPGVNYWWYDSAYTPLFVTKNNASDSDGYNYYLENVSESEKGKCTNLDSGGTSKGKTGYFPFNQNAQASKAYSYNYGFGTKMSFDFRLTSDGTVKDSKGNDVPIRFRFSGDDDVWVFIDGTLVLDCGGSHGKVTGVIDFSKNTAYVSNVKQAGDSRQKYTDASNCYQGVNDKKLTYLSSEETYNCYKKFDDLDKSKTHTITLFYMERGMWESNMSVAFNFPDENQLQVQKKVDTSGVNEKFADLFSDQSVFSFTLKNLVTHYGTTTVSLTGTKETRVFAKKFSGTVEASNTSNVFEKKTDSDVCVHWKAKLSNTNHAWTKERLGIFSADDKTTKDISDMKYLKFDIKDDTGAPSLSRMYLVFTDENGNTAGGYLNQKVYGTSSVAKATWTTLTVDLEKFLTVVDSGFDKTKIKTIGFQYDESHDIYLKNFVFYPSASYIGSTGFVIKQDAIPDYGSAASGSLELVNGATYTSSVGDKDKAYVIGTDGTFALENEETITFHDQFRRGSYLQLTENLTEAQKSLFETRWTMYENDNSVKSSMPKEDFKSVTGKSKSLVGIETEIVDDGRTETKDAQDNNKNKYDGVRPDNTFIFRSYREADNETIFNRQKIVFTNKVRTGSLTISKQQAEESMDLSGKVYTFYVVFSNVGGMALENEPITMGPYKLAVGATETITGIPLNTDYRIYEVDPTDDSKLQKVEIDGKEVSIATGTITDNKNGSYIEGVITNKHTAEFYNSEVPLANIKIMKKWVGQSDAQPNTVILQLQRRTEGGSDQDWKAVNGYESIVLSRNEESTEDSDTTVWSQTLQKLEVYVSGKDGAKYEYRLVELDDDGKVIQKRGTFGKQYSVTYSDGIILEKNESGELCVTNTLNKYELPKTGAIGTKVFATAGSVIMVLGLMAFLIMRMPEGVHTNKCSKKGKRGRKK